MKKTPVAFSKSLILAKNCLTDIEGSVQVSGITTVLFLPVRMAMGMGMCVLVMLAMVLTRAITGHARHAGPLSASRPGKPKVS